MDAFEHCAQVTREFDRDRYIADLFAPSGARRYLVAIHAFNAEVARIRDTVSDPNLGEIRLQWWRDALLGGGVGNPVADALTETIRAFALPLGGFEALLDARIFDLYDDQMPTLNDLEGYAGETSSALMQFAAIVLAGGDDPRVAKAAGHAGVAYALAGLMRAFPVHAARGQCFLPADITARHGLDRASLATRRATPELLAVLAELRGVARQHLETAMAELATVPRPLKPAFLPLAVVKPVLDRMERPGYDPFATPDLALWRRHWVMWRAAGRW